MGQYYFPVKTGKRRRSVDQWLLSHDYGNGLKLMEHSWIKNEFVGAVEKLLTPYGAWHKQHIVWAGDYADTEKNSNRNLYRRCFDKKKINPPSGLVGNEFKYIINHTKRLFVDKERVPMDKDGWRIHPLPLLTCEGNGRGGGDFRGESDIVGSWARDIISVDKVVPKNFKELIFDLTE